MAMHLSSRKQQLGCISDFVRIPDYIVVGIDVSILSPPEWKNPHDRPIGKVGAIEFGET